MCVFTQDLFALCVLQSPMSGAAFVPAFVPGTLWGLGHGARFCKGSVPLHSHCSPPKLSFSGPLAEPSEGGGGGDAKQACEWTLVVLHSNLPALMEHSTFQSTTCGWGANVIEPHGRFLDLKRSHSTIHLQHGLRLLLCRLSAFRGSSMHPGRPGDTGAL